MIAAPVLTPAGLEPAFDLAAYYPALIYIGVIAGLAVSMLALVAMVIADSVILLMALRFVGVGPEQLSTVDVIGGFLIAYPLTLMPLAGLGVLDAALLAAYTEIAGLAWEAEIVAALMVWRTITIGGPLALGALTLAWWRRTSRASATEPAVP